MNFFCLVIINKIMALYRNIHLYYCVRSKTLSSIAAAGSGGGGGEWSKAISGFSCAVSVGQILHFAYYSIQRLVHFFVVVCFSEVIGSFERFSVPLVSQPITVLGQNFSILVDEKWCNKKFHLRQLIFMLVDVNNHMKLFLHIIFISYIIFLWQRCKLLVLQPVTVLGVMAIAFWAQVALGCCHNFDAIQNWDVRLRAQLFPVR